MPKAKFESIYKDLKQKIEMDEYHYQDFLPSENTLVNVYDCSRNTIRRAVSELTELGYVQPLHGKGVRNSLSSVASIIICVSSSAILLSAIAVSISFSAFS